MVLPLIGALAMLRSMKRLAFVSIVGNVAIAVSLGVVFYFSAERISLEGVAFVAPFRVATLPLFFGTCVCRGGGMLLGCGGGFHVWWDHAWGERWEGRELCRWYVGEG